MRTEVKVRKAGAEMTVEGVEEEVVVEAAVVLVAAVQPPAPGSGRRAAGCQKHTTW